MGSTSSLKSGSPEEQLTSACQLLNQYQFIESNQRFSRSLITFFAHIAWYIYEPESRAASLPEFCTPIATQISADKHASQYAIIVIDKAIVSLYQGEYYRQFPHRYQRQPSKLKEDVGRDNAAPTAAAAAAEQQPAECDDDLFSQLLDLDLDAIIVYKGADSNNIFDIFEGIGCVPDPIEFHDIYTGNVQQFLSMRQNRAKADKRKARIERKFGVSHAHIDVPLLRQLRSATISPRDSEHVPPPYAAPKLSIAAFTSSELLDIAAHDNNRKSTNQVAAAAAATANHKKVSFATGWTPRSTQPMPPRSTHFQSPTFASKRHFSSTPKSKKRTKSILSTMTPPMSPLSGHDDALDLFKKHHSVKHSFLFSPHSHQRKSSNAHAAPRVSFSFTDDAIYSTRASASSAFARRRQSRATSKDDSHLNLTGPVQRPRKGAILGEEEYGIDEAHESWNTQDDDDDDDTDHEDTELHFNQYLDDLVARSIATPSKTPKNGKSQSSSIGSDALQREFDLIEEKVCASQLYAHDPIGIHASVYAAAKRDMYVLSLEVNKEILRNESWRLKIVNGQKINIMTTGHSLGGAVGQALLFRTLLKKHRDHIPSAISPFVDIIHSISFGPGSIVAYPYADVSNVHVQDILQQHKSAKSSTSAAATSNDDKEHKNKKSNMKNERKAEEAINEFNVNMMTMAARLSPETRRFLLEYGKRTHVVVNNFDMITRLPNTRFWRNKLIYEALQQLILGNKQLNEGLLGFIPQSTKREHVEKLTNWLMENLSFSTHDGVFESYAPIGNYYLLIGGPTSFTASRVSNDKDKPSKASKQKNKDNAKSPLLTPMMTPVASPVFLHTTSEENNLNNIPLRAPNLSNLGSVEESEVSSFNRHGSRSIVSFISDMTTYCDPVTFTNYEPTSFKPSRLASNKSQSMLNRALSGSNSSASTTNLLTAKLSKKTRKQHFESTPCSIFTMNSHQIRPLLSMAPTQLKEDLTHIFYDHSIKNYILNLNPSFVFNHDGSKLHTMTPRVLSPSQSPAELEHSHSLLELDSAANGAAHFDAGKEVTFSVNGKTSKSLKSQKLAKSVESHPPPLKKKVAAFRTFSVETPPAYIPREVNMSENKEAHNSELFAQLQGRSRALGIRGGGERVPERVRGSAVVRQAVTSENATELFGSKANSILGVGYTASHKYQQFETTEIISGESERWKYMLSNERTFLMKSLNQTTVVKSLDLSNNGKYFGDEGVRSLCQVLMKNRSIENVNVSGNCITSEGAGFLGRLIDKFHRLRFLDLSNNQIGDDGVSQICDGLIHNKVLRQLIIYNNKFSNKGFMELTRVIVYNANLRELILWEPF